jgi:hypothetical protein
MYKVKQIAEMLNVETVRIHEKLIELRDVLATHVSRQNSILYIDYDGYQILKRDIELEINQQVLLAKNDLVGTDANQEINEFSNGHKQEQPLTDVEIVKGKMSIIKQEINKLDLQIHREMEALAHYHKQIRSDVNRLKNLTGKE